MCFVCCVNVRIEQKKTPATVDILHLVFLVCRSDFGGVAHHFFTAIETKSFADMSACVISCTQMPTISVAWLIILDVCPNRPKSESQIPIGNFNKEQKKTYINLSSTLHRIFPKRSVKQ